jgi:hypothetical protein
MITTHSPYLVSYFQPEEVTFLGMTKARAQPLRDAPPFTNVSRAMSSIWASYGELFGDG